MAQKWKSASQYQIVMLSWRNYPAQVIQIFQFGIGALLKAELMHAEQDFDYRTLLTWSLKLALKRTLWSLVFHWIVNGKKFLINYLEDTGTVAHRTMLYAVQSLLCTSSTKWIVNSIDVPVRYSTGTGTL